MLAIAGIVVGAIGAIVGAAAAVYTVRSSRRLTAANAVKISREADHQADINTADLRQELSEEFAKRRDVEEALAKERRERHEEEERLATIIASQGRRINRLEEQVKSMGGVPVNGG